MKKIMAIMLSVFLLLIMITGCSNIKERDENIVLDDRFEIIKREHYDSFKIIRDNDTGVLYLYIHEGYSGGLTVIVDSDGLPLMDYEE